MMKKFRARFSSAHLVALLALFVVLGGSAYAVKKNSIGTKQLKNNAVATSKIKNGAVKTDKIGDNAVTGAKVDESTLGQVPSAAAADSATTATTATDATNAQNAVNAQSAADSTTLAGRAFQQVRGLADGASTGTDNGLPALAFETVLTEDLGIPTGGADVIVNASVDLNNGSGAQAGAQCRINDESGAISQSYNVTLPPGFSTNIGLTAFNNYPTGTSVFDPEDFTVQCQGSGANDDIDFQDGDIAVQRIPDGA